MPIATSDPAWKDALLQGLLFVGILVGWFALSRWVLPRFGIPT